MRISIIVPTLNEESQIASTLAALQCLSGDKEIIVADGGSTDRTTDVAAEHGAAVIRSARGRGQQMHAGTVRAGGDVLWFVHADTIPPVHALEAIASALEDGSVVGGNFGLRFNGQSRSARQLTAIYPWLRRLGLCYGDSGVFVRRDVYGAIGGFAPIALFEDLDLLRRLRQVGRFVHLPCQVVTSSRRFEHRNFAVVWIQWTALQVLYWCGVPPNLLARYYCHARRLTG
jgi:rSAM/selenodomain-associated transferase 2